MLAVSSIAVTLWLGGWMRPFPNAPERLPLGPGRFSLIPALALFVPLGIVFAGHGAHAKDSPAFRIQTIGLGTFGACTLGFVGLLLLVPAVRPAGAGHFLVRHQSCILYVLTISGIAEPFRATA